MGTRGILQESVEKKKGRNVIFARSWCAWHCVARVTTRVKAGFVAEV